MADDDFGMVLDGNAVAGLLQEIFALEITGARIQCDSCGSTDTVGALRAHASPMGAILRCLHCSTVLIRAVHTPHGYWFEMTRARCLRF